MVHRSMVAVAFAAAAALSAGCRSASREFPNQGGSYESPDVVVPAAPGEPAPIPVELGCPGRLVVYAADLEVVPNCANAGAAFLRTIGNAAAKAAAYAQDAVTCKPDCTKQISFLWVGWKCGPPNPIAVVSAVEVLVECVPPPPPGPGDVSP